MSLSDPPTNRRMAAALPMMSVQLRIHRRPSGREESQTRTMHVTSPAAVVVGRHSSCEVQLEGDDISRQHARIILGPDSFTAEDLSSNGTKTSTGEHLRRTRRMFPYGTFLEIGPYRIIVGHSQQRETAVAPNGLRVDTPSGVIRQPQTQLALEGGLGQPRINARGSGTPTRGVAVIRALTGEASNASSTTAPPPPLQPQPTQSQPPRGSGFVAHPPSVIVATEAMPPLQQHQQPHQLSPMQHAQLQAQLQMQAQLQAQARMQQPPPMIAHPAPQPQPQPQGVSPTQQQPQQLPPGIQALQELKMSDELLGLRRKIHQELLKNLDFAKIDPTVADPALRPRVLTALKRIVREQNAPILDRIDRDAFIGELLEEALGLGPLEPLLADPAVTEIMVVDPATIYVERAGKLELTTTRFTDEERVRAVIERIVTPLGRRIDESQPLVDARLPDGSRVNAIIRPLALRGSCITIRRFPKRRLTVDDFVRLGSVTPRIAKFLERAVVAKKNILISGGTGSGKTTLLNVLSASIPSVERIVTIEDAAELQLHQPHVVSLETKHANMEGKGAFTIRDLVKNALRMRPDRIVVGECRGGEALDMLQAMNTGHDGSLTTIHANSPIEALSRLETLVLMAGVDLPSQAIREQISRSIHVIVQQSRCSDGSRKITAVSEIDELDAQTGRFEVRPIFEYEQTGVAPDGSVIGDFQATGYLPSFLDELLTRGLIKPGEAFL